MIYKILEAPITVADLKDVVVVNNADEPEPVLRAYVEDANTTTEVTGNMVWIDPEKDKQLVKINGRICEYGGATLRATGRVDLGIRPHRGEHQSA